MLTDKAGAMIVSQITTQHGQLVFHEIFTTGRAEWLVALES